MYIYIRGYTYIHTYIHTHIHTSFLYVAVDNVAAARKVIDCIEFNHANSRQVVKKAVAAEKLPLSHESSGVGPRAWAAQHRVHRQPSVLNPWLKQYIHWKASPSDEPLRSIALLGGQLLNGHGVIRANSVEETALQNCRG